MGAKKAFFVIACADGSERRIEGIGVARQELGLQATRGRSREKRVLAAVQGLSDYELVSHQVDSRRRITVFLRERPRQVIEPPQPTRCAWPFPLVVFGDGQRFTGSEISLLALMALLP